MDERINASQARARAPSWIPWIPGDAAMQPAKCIQLMNPKLRIQAMVQRECKVNSYCLISLPAWRRLLLLLPLLMPHACLLACLGSEEEGEIK